MNVGRTIWALLSAGARFSDKTQKITCDWCKNFTCGSSQIIGKLSFFCLQVPNKVYIIFPRPEQTHTKSNVFRKQRTVYSEHIFCKKAVSKINEKISSHGLLIYVIFLCVAGSGGAPRGAAAVQWVHLLLRQTVHLQITVRQLLNNTATP